MRSTVRLALSIVALSTISSTVMAADIGVSIGVPGIYGRIDLGGVPAPQVLYNQPVVIDRGPGYVEQPVYLHVPPGHARNWRRYCRNYDACNRPAYFVRDDWYRNVYTPRYREVHAGDDRRGGGPRDDHRGPGFDRHDDHREGRGEERRDDRGRGPDDRGGRN